MNDEEKLIEICDKTGELDDTSEYQLLVRLLNVFLFSQNLLQICFRCADWSDIIFLNKEI